jgi:hypothetical protein
MMNAFPRSAAGLVLVLAVAESCTGPGASTPPGRESVTPAVTPSVSTGGSSPAPARTPLVVGCEDAVTPVDPRWRSRSTVVGPFGWYGDGRDFRVGAVERPASHDLVTKVPAIVEGRRAVRVSVPPGERDRVGLVYGPKLQSTFPDGVPAITFQPCREEARTAWAGGLVLRDRRPVTLDVRLQGTHLDIPVVVGRPPTSPWRCPSPERSAGRGRISLPEVRGSSVGGSLWALLFGEPPFHRSPPLKIVWRMTGSGDFGVVAIGPRGAVTIPVDGPTKHLGSTWRRPGDEWGTVWKFPTPGCWQLHAWRDDVSGDVWLRVTAPNR